MNIPAPSKFRIPLGYSSDWSIELSSGDDSKESNGVSSCFNKGDKEGRKYEEGEIYCKDNIYDYDNKSE